MKVNEAINRIDELKPNTISQAEEFCLSIAVRD